MPGNFNITDPDYPFDYFRVNPTTDTKKVTRYPMSIHFE